MHIEYECKLLARRHLLRRYRGIQIGRHSADYRRKSVGRDIIGVQIDRAQLSLFDISEQDHATRKSDIVAAFHRKTVRDTALRPYHSPFDI